MTNPTTEALLDGIFPKRYLSPEHLAKVRSFFDFCQTAVLASWVKADDATFDPRSFVGVPLETVVKLSSDTKPGGEAVWEKHNMLNGTYNREFLVVQGRLEKWYEERPYAPVAEAPTMRALKVLSDYQKFTIDGRAYGTRTVTNNLVDAFSPIYVTYLDRIETDDYVVPNDTAYGKNKDTRRVSAWGTMVPALNECGWFPDREFASINMLTKEYTKSLRRPDSMNTFQKFEAQARETTQIMLTEADEYWSKP